MQYTIQDKDLEIIIKTLRASDPLNQYTVELRQDLIRQYEEWIVNLKKKEEESISKEDSEENKEESKPDNKGK
jgi:hypothetical protein